MYFPLGGGGVWRGQNARFTVSGLGYQPRWTPAPKTPNIFFGAPEGVKHNLWGGPNATMLTESPAPDDVSGPPRRADSKTAIFTRSEIGGPGPPPAPCRFSFRGRAFRKSQIGGGTPPRPVLVRGFGAVMLPESVGCGGLVQCGQWQVLIIRVTGGGGVWTVH